MRAALLFNYTQRSSTDTQHRAATARTTQHKDRMMTSSEGNERGKKNVKKTLDRITKMCYTILKDQDKKRRHNTMTKKQAKEKAKKMRVFIPMNTGTRVEQTKKSYNRRTSKQETRRLAKDYD